jgi:hypothetical protein
VLESCNEWEDKIKAKTANEISINDMDNFNFMIKALEWILTDWINVLDDENEIWMKRNQRDNKRGDEEEKQEKQNMKQKTNSKNKPNHIVRNDHNWMLDCLDEVKMIGRCDVDGNQINVTPTVLEKMVDLNELLYDCAQRLRDIMFDAIAHYVFRVSLMVKELIRLILSCKYEKMKCLTKL